MPLLGRVHLQEAALHLHIGGRDGDAHVAVAFVVHVVIVGQVLRGAGEFEDLLVPGGDPVAPVRAAPRHRAPGEDLGRDVLELLPVFRCVPIEVIAVLLTVRAVRVSCHVSENSILSNCK